MREYELYLIRHGQVFFDPVGEFSARRAALKHYPRLARMQRVWDELFGVWHYGQYNFLSASSFARLRWRLRLLGAISPKRCCGCVCSWREITLPTALRVRV